MVLVHDRECIGELEEEGHDRGSNTMDGFNPVRSRLDIRFPHSFSRSSSVHPLSHPSRFISWHCQFTIQSF